MAKQQNRITLNEGEKAISYTTFGNLNYVFAKPGMMVYDKHGKRKIGKDSRVPVCYMDRIVYNSEKEYVVTKFADGYVILKGI